MGKWIEPTRYGGTESRGGDRWPRNPRLERDGRAMFGRSRPWLWLEVLFWVVVAVTILAAALAGGRRVGDKAQAMGRWAWVSPAGREVAAETGRWEETR